jgi:malonyl-CoA/methylmalonyl-CoA synthetase
VSLPPSLPHAFVRTAARTPERPFVVFDGTTISYGEMHRRVTRAAGALAARGIRRGDRIGLHLENSPVFLEAYLAVLWLGAVVVPINTRYRTQELEHVVADAGARLVLTDAEGAAFDEVSMAAVRAGAAVLRLSTGAGATGAGFAAAGGGDPLGEPVPLAHADLAVIGYTSGTTGRSRGAMLDHGNFLANSRAVTEAWRWTAADHLLLALPLFHTHGLAVGLHGTILQGSSMTLLPRFEEGAVCDELVEGRASMFFGVPTMFARLVEEARRRVVKPKGLRLLVSGSAPLNPRTLEDIEEALGLRILERYGMTETVMNLGNPFDGERRAGSVGWPFDGVEVRIADLESDAPLGQGHAGEIQLRGPNVFRGYWRDPDATRAAFTTDGWFKTGDLGFVDGDGYHFIVGRAKELIISGGFNVHPREVEEVLEQHPLVGEAAVVGLPDGDLGEKVVAAIVPRDPAPTAEALVAHCRSRIAGFKKPREIHFVDALPRNALGKVQKHVLRQTLATVE